MLGGRGDERKNAKEKENVRAETEQMVDYQAFYQSYIKELKERHEANVHRIRIGIRMNVFLPLVFLFISFVIGGSRFLFLVLWIVSLFGIAGYLIFVEYSDFVLQEKLMELEGKEAGEPEPLIRVEDREAQIESLQGKISGVKKATRKTLRQIAGAKSCIKKSHKQKSHTQKSPTQKSHKQKSHKQKSHTEKPNPEESLSSKESTEIRKELPHA